MTEPTLDPLVQQALLNMAMEYDVLPFDPDMGRYGCLLLPYGFAIERGGRILSSSPRRRSPPQVPPGTPHSHVDVQLARDGGALVINVLDDGPNPDHCSGGFGLVGLAPPCCFFHWR
jgi:hypothetical protein